MPAMRSFKPALLASLLALSLLVPPRPAMAESWDLRAVQVVNQKLASPAADDIATFLTDPLVTGGAVTLVAIGHDPRHYQAAATGLAAEVVGIGLAEGLKAATHRPRPYVVDPSLRTPAGKEPDSSFPSGHTTVAFAGATVLAFDAPELAPYGYAFATLVGLSRIYEGVHYPTDVLAGAALGSLVAWGVVAGRNALQAHHWLPAPPALAASASGGPAPLAAAGMQAGLPGGPLAVAFRF